MRERKRERGEKGVELGFEEMTVKDEEWVRVRIEGESSGALLRTMSVNSAGIFLTSGGF